MAKIAFVHHSLVAGSGIDGVIYEMASRLADRHQVNIFTLRTDNSYKELPGLTITSGKSHGSRIDALFMSGIRSKLKGYDVVCTQLYPASVLPLFPRKLSIKHVMTYWGVQSIKGVVNSLYSGFLRQAEDWAAKRADIVLAGCQYTGGQLKKIRPDVITLNQYGIDFDTLNDSKFVAGRLEQKYKISKNDHILLFVGRNSPHKRIDILIKSLSLIKDSKVKLVIVGRNDFREYQASLEDLTYKLGLENRVLFTGVVSRKEVIDWYCRCEMFVNASEWEGFLIPEAFAFRKPIIAYNAPPHKETISYNTRGILVTENAPDKYAEAVKLLLLYPGIAYKMGRVGYEWAKENLDYERIVEKWESIVL